MSTAVALVRRVHDARRYSRSVPDDDETLTAEELEALTPNERHELLNRRVATDLASVPPEFVARAKAKGRALLEARGVLGSRQQ